jgi:hypothetical protein
MLYPYPSISKFAQFVQLKDYRQPTKKEYVRYLLRFADHLQRDPATATQDDLRRYYLFLRQHKKFGPSAMKLAKCGGGVFAWGGKACGKAQMASAEPRNRKNGGRTGKGDL